LYAENSRNSFQHYVGEIYGGGVVFYVYRDQSGYEHGLVVSLVEQSSNITWGCENQTVNASSFWDGYSNTIAIVSLCGVNTAAGVCRSYSYQNYNDWYLPSSHEIELLYNNKFLVSKALNSISGSQDLDILGNTFWTSTQPLLFEWNSNTNSTDSIARNALAFYPPFNGSAHSDLYPKSFDLFHTRAIRKF
jgi:hypothetical protein